MIGTVVIGRNEGQRLATSLTSIPRAAGPRVYVDSGSVDDSVGIAKAFGYEVVILSDKAPFTAARARNAGFQHLVHRWPIDAVQFVDGDCELVPGWIVAARLFLSAHPKCAIVCGRRRERAPEASIFNYLCDREWDTPVGPADACGGDAMVRTAAFAAVGGFDEGLIAGEEPDLCHRLRRTGWTIERIDYEMTIHDAAMTRFAQWWQRNRRSGYAFAEALARRGRHNPELRRQVVSNVIWALPLAWPFWPLLWWRVRRRGGALFATFIALGKLPQCHGQLDYWLARRRQLIEYK